MNKFEGKRPRFFNSQKQTDMTEEEARKKSPVQEAEPEVDLVRVPRRTLSPQTVSRYQEYRYEQKITVQNDDMVDLYMEFSQIPEAALKDRITATFERPTAIQAQSWPILLEGKDLIGIAKTGSGKTLGYLLPMFIQIKHRQKGLKRYNNQPIGLVLGPTRELVQQIHTESQKYTKDLLNTVAVYGGVNKQQQVYSLDYYRTDILIATPGRLIDLMGEGQVDLSKVTSLVLDEADRMLDMGFEPQIRQIMQQVRGKKQLCMFSATWPREIQRLANSYMNKAVHIQVGEQQQTVNQDIRQFFLVSNERQKETQLLNLFQAIDVTDYKCLIFCQTKRKCDELSDFLLVNGFRNEAIHGDKGQKDRDRILNQFKKKRLGILIASDVAARGLDIRDIQLVVNLDMPSNIDSYVHRIGRTGRAGNKGVSISFVSSNDQGIIPKVWKVLQQQDQPKESLRLIQQLRQSDMHYVIQRMVREERPDYSNINAYLEEHCPRPQMTEHQKERETNGGLEKSEYDRHDRRDKYRGDRGDRGDRDRPDTKYQFNFRGSNNQQQHQAQPQQKGFINSNLKREDNPNNQEYSNRPAKQEYQNRPTKQDYSNRPAHQDHSNRPQETTPNNPPQGRPRFFNSNRQQDRQ